MQRHESRPGAPRLTTAGLLLAAFVVVMLVGAFLWMSPDEQRAHRLVREAPGPSGAVGTAGIGDAASAALDPIRDVETITGATDAHQLAGRRVDIHVPVQQRINDVAFWVGPPDNRVLVVRASGPQQPAEGAMGAGQPVTIVGTIERVPYAEAMYGWGLTSADRAELMDRRVYVRADRVTPNGAVGTSGRTDSNGVVDVPPTAVTPAVPPPDVGPEPPDPVLKAPPDQSVTPVP